MNRNLPHSSILRKNYAHQVRLNCIEKVRKLLFGHRIYTMIDETQDAKGRNVAGFVVGSLDDPTIGPFLIYLKNIEKQCDTESYVKFYWEGLSELFPNGNSL